MTSAGLRSRAIFIAPPCTSVEKLRREGNLLHYQASVEDPNVLAKPWVRTPVTLKISASPDDALWEDPPCMELDTGHFVTKEHH